jgi:hypothetical protein
MSTFKEIVVFRMWMNPDGTTRDSEYADVYEGDVILPQASLEHVREMADLHFWKSIMRCNSMWKQEWENIESMQRMILNLAADIWTSVRRDVVLWDLGKDDIMLKKHMDFYDDTIAGRRAAELYFRAGYMVAFTFHPDFIEDDDLSFRDLLHGLSESLGKDLVATAKIKCSCPNWTVIFNE